MSHPQRLWGDSFFHVPEGTPYFVENSRRGVLRANAKRLTLRRRRFHYGLDIDVQFDADGLDWGTHWSQPLLHGFEWDRKATPAMRVLPKSVHIGELHEEQIKHLVARDNGKTYRIRRATLLVRWCLALGLGAEVELKSDVVADRPAVADRFAEDLRGLPGYRFGRVWAKTLTSIPKKAGKRLQAMRDRGIPALLLSHDDRELPPTWKPGAGMVDDVRGHARWAA